MSSGQLLIPIEYLEVPLPAACFLVRPPVWNKSAPLKTFKWRSNSSTNSSSLKGRPATAITKFFSQIRFKYFYQHFGCNVKSASNCVQIVWPTFWLQFKICQKLRQHIFIFDYGDKDILIITMINHADTQIAPKYFL